MLYIIEAKCHSESKVSAGGNVGLDRSFQLKKGVWVQCLRWRMPSIFTAPGGQSGIRGVRGKIMVKGEVTGVTLYGGGPCGSLKKNKTFIS